MATCNDCVHGKVCVILAFPDSFENTKWDKEPCDHFKPTANFVPRIEVAKQKAMLFDAIATYRNLLCIESWLDYEDTEKHYVVSIDDVCRIYEEIRKKYTEGERYATIY